jgi:hypothetical protein
LVNIITFNLGWVYNFPAKIWTFNQLLVPIADRPTKATKAVEGCCTMEAAAAAERGQAPAANLGADQAAAASKKRRKPTPKPRKPAQEGAPILLLFRSQLPLF